jgi:hypothetical protein
VSRHRVAAIAATVSLALSKLRLPRRAKQFVAIFGAPHFV